MAGIATLLAGRRALVLAPHPDDESLGCGGFIAAAVEAGISPYVVILTDGAASHPGSRAFPPARLAALRQAEALAAVACLGLSAADIAFLREPDTGLAATAPVIERLLAMAREQGCGLVVGPWAGDPHCDHEAGAEIAEAVAIRAGLPLLTYPVWGWLRDGGAPLGETRQGWRLDISAQLERKCRAIRAHASQLGGVITDAPDGFVLPRELLAIFERPFEVFLSQ